MNHHTYLLKQALSPYLRGEGRTPKLPRLPARPLPPQSRQLGTRESEAKQGGPVVQTGPDGKILN